MDTRTGIIAPLSDLQKANVPQRYIVEVDESKLTEAQRRVLHKRGKLKVGRNHPCPCGSGLKFKRCCWNKSK